MLKKRILLMGVCLLLIGCASKPSVNKASKSKETMNTNKNENLTDNNTIEETSEDDNEFLIPDKDVTLSTRRSALEKMNPEAISRLKNIVKSANLYLEHLYIHSALESRFSDPKSYYWGYLEQTGEFIQDYIYFDGAEEQGKAAGLSKEEIEQQFGEPIYAQNEYDAEEIIQLLKELQSTIYNEKFKQNFINMEEYIQKAKDTHNINYILNIYRILHDMDYYLLHYGPEDVGSYVEDKSTIETYYGILEDYRGTEYYNVDSILSD